MNKNNRTILKSNKIRLYYGIFLSVFTAVLGILFIFTAVKILADGNWVQGAYSRELVMQRLFPISFPFYIWIAAIIAGFVLSLIYPFKEKNVKRTDERVIKNRLQSIMPEGSGEEYDDGLKKIYVEKRSRIIVYSVCGAVCLAGVIASFIYLFTPGNFNTGTLNASMLNMLINIGPWLFAAVACCIGMTLYEKYSLLREIDCLKNLIKSGKGNPVVKNGGQNVFLSKVKKFFSLKYTKYGIRAGIAVISVTFIILGIFNEGVNDVLTKAINICTECIGLG